MTPEPSPVPSLVVTVTVQTEGSALAATAVAVEVFSSLGLMVMDWFVPVLKVAEPPRPMTPVPRSTPVSSPAPRTPPAMPRMRALAPRCSRLGFFPSSGVGARPGCWPGIGGTVPPFQEALPAGAEERAAVLADAPALAAEAPEAAGFTRGCWAVWPAWKPAS